MVVFEVRVSLAGAEPAVWRRVRMPGGLQLGMVHLVLQMAMGWTNSHQHEFAGADRKRYGSAEGHDLLPGVLNERHCRLSSLISEPGDGCLYRYDFGDDWMHEVVLEAVLEMDKPDEPLWCLDGQGACPPENCGGVAGYLELLEHFRESDSVEHVEAVEQLGKDFDPNAFDCGEFNEMIRAKDSMNDAMISSEDMVKAFEMLMELQVFLESDAVSDRAMSVLMLDGFFAALAIYPVPILLKQWLPFVWDRSGSGQQPVFATEKQKDTVIGQIHLLMNSINIRLTGANGMYEPPFVSLEPESAADRMQAAMEWASGFIRGAMIDKNVWERTLGDEEGNDLLLPFSVMSGIIDEETGIDPARMVEIRTLLIDDLGECVLDMRDFWRPWKSASMAVNSSGSKGNAHSRVGRNDPCPCGSGKKFKQCCGKQRRGEQ